MKRRTKRKIKGAMRTFLFITLPVFCFIGATTGTISWYSLNSKVSAEYHGTSISSSKQLQVGIVSDIDLSNVGLTMDNGIAWSAPGDGLLPKQVEEFLSRKGFASVQLPALTTGEFHNGDDISLKYSPTAEISTSVIQAEKEDYVNIPLAFRVIKSSSGDYLPNQPIWLTDSYVNTNAQQNIESGVRAFFDQGDGNTFIFKPGKSIEAGVTTVGGLMDLDFNGYYDYDRITGREILYGDYEGEPTYTYIEEDSAMQDINNTGSPSATTFYAKHKANTYAINSYEGITFKEQQYETISSISPIDTDSGYEGGKPICVTNSDEKVGYTNLTIWLEGWDHIVVDTISGFKFSLNLTFDINRV